MGIESWVGRIGVGGQPEIPIGERWGWARATVLGRVRKARRVAEPLRPSMTPISSDGYPSVGCALASKTRFQEQPGAQREHAPAIQIIQSPPLVGGCFRIDTYETQQVNTSIPIACRWVLQAGYLRRRALPSSPSPSLAGGCIRLAPYGPT